MKQILNEPSTYVIGYILMMIITFGNAYHRTPDEEIGKFAGSTYTIHNGPGIKATGAVLSSIFWPLYWSVKVQK